MKRMLILLMLTGCQPMTDAEWCEANRIHQGSLINKSMIQHEWEEKGCGR